MLYTMRAGSSSSFAPLLLALTTTAVLFIFCGFGVQLNTEEQKDAELLNTLLAFSVKGYSGIEVSTARDHAMATAADLADVKSGMATTAADLADVKSGMATATDLAETHGAITKDEIPWMWTLRIGAGHAHA